MKVQVFLCQHCGQRFERPTTRGNYPKWCATCKPKQYREGIHCDGCGVKGVSVRARHCSRMCAAYIRYGRWPSCTVPASHPSRIAPPVKGKTCRVFITDCCICDRTFATPYTVTTCSTVCTAEKKRIAKREDKHRHRARKRSAFVAPVSRRAIYERDRYRCHLCKRKVLIDQAVPHPRAAVLDHVIPLAVGGTHEPANVRTACFLCNSIKGAGGGGEQLMLIG